MTKKELNEYKKEKGKYHKSDPRHPMNSERTGPSVTIAIMPLPKSKPKKDKGKTKMMRGGMSGGKEHMYAAGGMVKGNSKGQKGTRPSETGAIVGNRKSNLKLVDKSNKAQPGRREATSRRGKPGNSELDAPGMNRGGMPKRKTQHMDYRKGGLLVSMVDNRRNK